MDLEHIAYFLEKRKDTSVEINNDTLFESVLHLACGVLVGSHCFFCEGSR